MTVVDLTTEAFERWLQAQRPPFEWFLAQPVNVQERLAELGEQDWQRRALDIGYCVRDPEQVQAVLSQDDQAAEQLAIERMARGVAAAAIQTLRTPSKPPQPQPSHPQFTFAGLTQRKAQAAIDSVDKGIVSLLGKMPDKIGNSQ